MPHFNLSATELLSNGLRFHMQAGCLLAPVRRVMPDPGQPRKEFKREILLSKKADVIAWRTAGRGIAGTGFLQPALGSWEPGAESRGRIRKDARIILADGEQRWRTNWTDADPEHGEIDWEWFPIVLDDMDAEERYEVAVRSQLHRGDLLPVEEAHAFLHIRKLRGWSQARLAKQYNVDLSYIENRERLLRYGDDIREMTNRRPDTISAARILDKVKNPIARKKLIRAAIDGASYAEIEERAEPYVAKDSRPAAAPAVMPRVDVPAYFENAARNLTEINNALTAVDMPKSYYRSAVAPHVKRLRALLDDIETGHN